jgi:polysaccharide biosynthesis/export protein
MGVGHRGAILILLGLASACTTTHPAINYAAEPDPRKEEYVIGPSDVVRITVWKNADLSGDATVRPDGTISLPLLGDLRAAGQTASQLRAEIATRLATFVKAESAIVTVAVAGINSYRFVVNGNVEKPGVYSSTHYVTLVEGVAMAGGPNRFASPDAMSIIRTGADGKVRRIHIDYPSILTGVHPEQDLPLLRGDTVYVP